VREHFYVTSDDETKANALGKPGFRPLPQDPSINRYPHGGEFNLHTDGTHLTLIILLSDKGAFGGGGTRLYGEDAFSQCSVDIKPVQGTALLFNGNVMHSALKVESGVRHVYVSSFNFTF
jgi:hypothetical protein